jgi:hypothetical protein
MEKLLALTAALGACTLPLAACGSTLSNQPVSSNPLEDLIALRSYPVYWLGSRYRGMPLTEVTHEVSGGVGMQYGDCVKGGQYACLTPLNVVTSPENSFRPHGARAMRSLPLRSVRAYAANGGRTLEIPTGSVVVSIYAERPAIARAAARAMVPLNETGQPGQPLRAPEPGNTYATHPLSSQMHTVRPPETPSG